MLRIHKPNHKLLTLGIASICSIGVLLGFFALTYTPELSHAESITYEPTINSITYMQEMTPGVCQGMELEKQYQLKDARDNKVYWVGKLKDGNCWMTQNLALDLSTSSPLTSELSDVSSSWTPTANTQQGTITKFPSSSDLTLSYNPGEYVYTTPTTQNNCGTSGISKLEGCPNWTLVSGLSKDTSANEQAHYLAGNYYSYTVATAGYTSSSGTAPNSICPKGWQLPTSNSTTASKSFGYLLTQYGLASSVTAGDYDLRLSPLYFVYGGGVIGDTLESAGNVGYYWSSSAYDSILAYGLEFNIGVNPFNYNNRYGGRPIRCVAKTITNNIEITVNPTITLDVASEVTIDKTDTNPSTTALPVFVASNQPYSVSISSTSPNMTSSTSSTIIPSKSGTLTTNENAWGVKLSTASTYTQITTTPKLFYSSTTPESKTLLFDIGISTAPDIPNGEYSTNITITATQN